MAQAVPFVMAFLSAASVVMTYQQGQAAKKQRDQQAAIEEQNRLDERERRAFEVKAQMRRDYLRLSAARAQAGKMGGTGGSALDVLADIAHQGVLEREEITRLGEARERNFSDKAGMYRAAGKAEKKAYNMQAATQLLSGGAKTIVAFDEAGYFG